MIQRMILAAATALLLPACAPPPASAPGSPEAPSSGAPYALVSPQEARARLQQEPLLVVDVRSRARYDESHIEGAVSSPLVELETGHALLPKDRFILLYCT